MDPTLVGVISIFGLIALLFMGVHVAAALGLVGVLGFSYMNGWGPGLFLAGTTPYSVTSTFQFLAIPMFIIMGQFTRFGGIGEDVYKACDRWLGNIRGGLAMATTASCAAFAAASGSSVATAATFTQVALPEMLRYGYDKRLAAGAIAASGTLGALIPPSGLLVFYGIMTEQSIGRLLIAGLIPGLLSALLYILMVSVLVRILPHWAPKPRAKVNWGERFASLPGVWGVIALAVVVLGSIYFGFATPTEAAAMGAFGALIIIVAKRRLSRAVFTDSILDTAKTTTMLFAIIIGAFIFGRFLSVTGIGNELAIFLMSKDIPPMLVIWGFFLMYMVLGMFMDPAAMMAITLPIVFPIVEGLGYSGIWFGIMIIKVSEIGLITPPVGLNVYTVHAAAEGRVSLEDVFQGITPYLITDIITLAILASFPILSLWLPGLMMG